MDKLSAMTAFSAVARHASFAEAARQSGMSRSQINKLVIRLEDELGVTLFNRTTRKVTLTATGTAYFERVRQILSDITETESFLKERQETPSGDIKINGPMSFGTLHLSQAIVEFMELYPDIRVQLILTDELVDPVSNGFDITIRIASPTDSLSLIEHDIVEARRIICVSPAFLTVNPVPQTPESLRNLPCLHYGNLPTGNSWKLKGPEGERYIKVNGVLCSNNAEVLKDACVAGMGFALLPTFIVGDALTSGQLVQVLSDYQAPELSLCLLYSPNRHLSTRIRLFVKFIQQKFGDKPFWDEK